ncbi:MAG: GntR family transcriptional regulator, partial [Synergistaceae bacterium]|nr:GntR family transcriptional regulator [Synergistaceae bacterium]
MGIVQESIQNQLYEEIKQHILKKRYKMGDQLNPKILAAQYNVSPMPVRDALLHLTRQGLVVNRARVGFYVATYTASEIKDLMEVRKMHEMFCLNQYFDLTDHEKIKKIHQCMSAHLHKDKALFDRCDFQFHDLLINTSKNRFLNMQYAQIKELLQFLVYYDAEHDEEALADHEKIVNALLQ